MVIQGELPPAIARHCKEGYKLVKKGGCGPCLLDWGGRGEGFGKFVGRGAIGYVYMFGNLSKIRLAKIASTRL